MDDVYEVLDQARDDGERRRMLDRHPGLRSRRSVRQLLDRAEEAYFRGNCGWDLPKTPKTTLG